MGIGRPSCRAYAFVDRGNEGLLFLIMTAGIHVFCESLLKASGPPVMFLPEAADEAEEPFLPLKAPASVSAGFKVRSVRSPA